MKSGDIISRYTIVGPLGKGGMGIVYRAEDTRLNRVVALKFLPADSLTANDRLRFVNEARAAARVRHPNICPIYDIEEVDGRIFIAMACLEGETLAKKIDGGPIAPAEAVSIAIQALAGLAKAHEIGVVHRDIKSNNIIVGPDGHVCILDFGLAVWPGAARVTRVGQTVGTPGYMSPEQMLDGEVDERSDIWSMGVVLFEMLMGVLPFQRQAAAAVAHAIVTADVPVMPGVPAELERVIRRALTKEPGARWQTAKELAIALERAGVSGDTEATQTMLLPLVRKTLRGWYAIAAVVLALVGAFTAYQIRPTHLIQVAVVPFNVIGSAESTRNISDGFVEVLTTALSEVEETQGKFMTVPASEVRRRHIDSAEEARRVYGVDMAITGSAQPIGEKVEFTANVVDTAKKRTLQGKTFVYDPKDPIQSRNDAVKDVVGLLKFDLTPASRRAIAAGDTKAPGAYTAYLEGKGLLARYDLPGNIERAVTAFEEATRQDPHYALAYTGLAEAYWRKGRTAGDKTMAALAIENAERAVQLDSNLALSHTVLGQVYGAFGRQEDAVPELRKALQLSPGNSDAARELARVYNNLGKFAEAESSYRSSIAARPADWYGHLLLGVFFIQQERYDEAVSALSKAKTLAPGNDVVASDLGAVYLQQGRYAEAVHELQFGLRVKPTALNYASLAAADAYQHRFQQSISAIEAALNLDASRYFLWGNAGIYYKWAGNNRKASVALEKAVGMDKQLLAVSPDNYNARADLAEYHARLGNCVGAMGDLLSGRAETPGQPSCDCLRIMRTPGRSDSDSEPQHEKSGKSESDQG